MFLTIFNIKRINFPASWTFGSDSILKMKIQFIFIVILSIYQKSTVALRRCKTISKQWIDFPLNFIWNHFKTKWFKRNYLMVMSVLQSNIGTEYQLRLCTHLQPLHQGFFFRIPFVLRVPSYFVSRWHL